MHPFASKLGEREVKALRMLNCGGIFDISNGLAVARKRIYGEKMKQEVGYNFSIHNLILMELQQCVRGKRPITWMWLLCVKVIAPPTGSRKCVTFKMLLTKVGGLLLPTVTKNQYAYWSHRAGQLSNLQSLAPSNRKSDILVWMWIFWICQTLSF